MCAEKINIAIAGLGHMGTCHYKNIKQNNLAGRIILVDNKKSSHVKYMNQALDMTPIDLAMIATPAETHFELLKNTLENGVKNIYVEKPAVLSKKESLIINDLIRRKNARVAVGYILRHSTIITAFLEKKKNLLEQGYTQQSCIVTYTKDKTKDPRRFTDRGIFEELTHILDLISSFVVENTSWRITSQKSELDPEIEGRIIEARIRAVAGNPSGTKIDIFSSFRHPEKKRRFLVEYKHPSKKSVFLELDFDSQDFDILSSLNNNRWTVHTSDKSSKKLQTMLTECIDWFFLDNKTPRIHTFENSSRLLDLEIPLEKNLVSCATRTGIAEATYNNINSYKNTRQCHAFKNTGHKNLLLV